VTRIKTLQAANTLEAAPARTTPRPQATVEEAITTRIRQRREEEPSQQLETTPPPVSPAMPAPLPTHAPESHPSLFQEQGERRSPAVPARKRPVRSPHRYASRQLSLLQSEGIQRSPAPPPHERPDLWQPPRQLSLL